jgi:hypothetical protein
VQGRDSGWGRTHNHRIVPGLQQVIRAVEHIALYDADVSGLAIDGVVPQLQKVCGLPSLRMPARSHQNVAGQRHARQLAGSGLGVGAGEGRGRVGGNVVITGADDVERRLTHILLHTTMRARRQESRRTSGQSERRSKLRSEEWVCQLTRSPFFRER